MDLNLDKKKKLQIIKELIKDPSIFYGSEYYNIIDLLDSALDLRALPTEDDRFDDAYGDAYQHLVNNDDWDLEYTFLSRFDFTEGDRLALLIEFLVKPDFQASEDKRLNLVDELNTVINKHQYALETSDFNDKGEPVFKLKDYDATNNYPLGVIKNTIEFIVNYEAKIIEEFKPDKNDVFILNFQPYSWWNDYGLRSRCNLIYRDSKGEMENFGELKIITNKTDNYSPYQDDNGNNIQFHTILPASFLELDDSYCSLGQKKEYYLQLKEKYPAKFRSILFALRDAAFFTEVSDVFDKEYYFRESLIRTNTAERILREIKHFVNGRSHVDMYKFTYLFQPKYSTDIPSIPISFDFEDSSAIPNRIFGIIGKNGVGKTQFISQLPKHLAEENKKFFEGKIPLFSKIIALSYSPFDDFKPGKSGVNVNYIFCSLRDEKGDVNDEKGRAIKFGITRKRIEELGRIKDWKNVLREFLPSAYIHEIFKKDENDKLQVNVEKLNTTRRELSSGQRVLLEAVTNIVAHIRYDSLLLFDEPETHLHPNAIAQLMNTIYGLVQDFESFCILTTHSPIIIRELLSRNVHVFDRIEDLLSIRKIGLECFGANLSDITEEVFGTNEIPKHFQEIIKSLKNSGKNYDEIIDAIKSENIPVSLNLKLYIKSIY